MQRSVSDTRAIENPAAKCLTNQIDNRDMFMKGIDYSYYYEQEDFVAEEETE